ncbi:DUF4350 domain-containing protein [Micromonospora andamanensis]|uniref:DUF4350 domain-containing protein n=1 Tax=Micromonospora andamanensis TaxID=1287068 RepID=A0ABQ4I4Y9_9ACTN|nr:DUF4350 domain-containing protein [Micromonospora andamanensis]GIJ12953.1 hypothetical protein Van01_61670 [Micromonospora andamanensis]
MSARGRRHRIVVPVLVAVLLTAITLVTREIDQPDQTDRGFLSPAATGDHGGSRLAASLVQRGVMVQRETDTIRALLATRPGPTTLFVPAPELLHPRTVGYLGLLPDGTRLVLVDPPRRVLAAAGLPLRPAGRRWATRAVPPHGQGSSCPLTEVVPAATAAVARQRYAPTGAPGSVDLCYAAGLARLPGAAESVVVGASDPFRNGRIDEWDNLAFATGLLATSGRVVWLDLDGPAPPPPEPSPAPTRPLPDRDDGTDEPGDPEDLDGGGNGETTPGGRPGGEASGPGGRGTSGEPNPLWSAFPPWFWALLLQLALAALLIAVGRARRLGPPTPEPLPVSVPAAETVLGRGRLYQRAHARESTARVLRSATLARLARRLHLPAEAPPDTVAAAVAAGTGDRPDAIHELLYGDAPRTDRDLLELAGDLDRVAGAGGSPPARPVAGAGGSPPAQPVADPPAPARLPKPRSEGDPR